MEAADAYEAYALDFLAARDKSRVGESTVKHWAESLAPHTEIIEIACGGGLPVTQALVDAGHLIWAVDASPTILRTFQSRFPDIPAQCVTAQNGDFFNRKFEAAISVGLLFLLSELEQVRLIRRVSEILLPGSRFLFTAPIEIGTWRDISTGHECISLGQSRYEQTLAESGFKPIANYLDEGRNNYYEVEKN